MLEIILLLLFAIGLLACIVLGKSVFIALGIGYIYFIGYALYKRHSVKDIVTYIFQGVAVVKKVLLNLILIGCITAAWRASGSIGYMINLGIGCIGPEVLLPGIFVLCSVISFLMGSAFGSSASAGVVCMALAFGMGVNPVLAGGAIVSGCYFGDRCSPVSTATLLVSDLTHTRVHDNIKLFLRSAGIPYILSLAIYAVLGIYLSASDVGQPVDYGRILSENYNLTVWTLIPVVAIIVLALRKVSTAAILAVSSTLALAVACICQGFEVTGIPELLIMGFHSSVPGFEAIIGGGGILSMLKAFGILLVSSGYSGLFSNTGFLDGMNQILLRLSRRIGSTTTLALVAAMVSCISCNQSLAIILTHDMCEREQKDPARFAVLLANTAVLIPALIPWNTAGIVPIMNIGAPENSILAEVFIYLVPIWTVAGQFVLSKRSGNRHIKYAD